MKEQEFAKHLFQHLHSVNDHGGMVCSVGYVHVQRLWRMMSAQKCLMPCNFSEKTNGCIYIVLSE